MRPDEDRRTLKKAKIEQGPMVAHRPRLVGAGRFERPTS